MSVYIAVPPPGQIRHTVNPPNIHKELAVVGVSTTILALVAVILQLFTRAYVTNLGIHLNDCEYLQCYTDVGKVILLTLDL